MLNSRHIFQQAPAGSVEAVLLLGSPILSRLATVGAEVAKQLLALHYAATRQPLEAPRRKGTGQEMVVLTSLLAIWLA